MLRYAPAFVLCYIRKSRVLLVLEIQWNPMVVETPPARVTPKANASERARMDDTVCSATITRQSASLPTDDEKA